MSQRPVVVSIIAVLMLMNGILTLITGYRLQAPPITLVLGVVAIVLSVGLWQLRSWAWVGTLLMQAVAIGFALYEWFTGGIIDFLAMILGAIIIIYFLRKETRAAFFQKQPLSAEDAS